MLLSLAERIKKVRKDLKLTQQELAGIFGVNPQRISDIERGQVINIKGNELEILQEKFGINPIWVSTGKGNIYSPCNKGTVVGVNHGSISVNTSDFNHSKDIKEIIELLNFAPPAYLKIIKRKLEEYKNIIYCEDE